MPSARPDRADVARHVPRDATVGTIDESQGREPADAALVRRSRARTVCQRPLALTEGHRDDREVGGCGRTRRRSEGCASTSPVAGGRLADQAGRHRSRTRVPRARTHAERRRGVDHVSPSERLHEGHLDHVSRDQAERDGCHASHLLHVPGTHARREVLRAELVGVAARR